MAAADSPPAKRRRFDGEREDSLIEGLPDHISELCLSLVSRPSLLAAVCTRWRRLLYSPRFPPFPSLYALFVDSGSDPDPNRRRVNHSIRFMCFDPVSSKWDPLPPPPPDPPLQRILYRHPSYISFNLPIQCVSAAGKLVLIAGSNRELSPAISRPLIFDPTSSTWTSGPPIGSPRRWCVTGACDGIIYMASGMGSQFSSSVAKSIEKLDLTDQNRINWEKLRDMRDLRFSREAIEAVGWRKKLLMVNVKGDAIKEGTIYDVVTDDWEAMPEEMVVGWRGPVAAMEEETLYSVDEKKGTVRTYDEEKKEWREVTVVEGGEEMLKGALQVTAVAGKLCVVTVDGRIVAVDVMAQPAKIWAVEIPQGRENMPMGVARRGRGRASNSVLPSWYPRTSLRDISAVVRAIERRRARMGGEGLGRDIHTPTPQQLGVPDSLIPLSGAQVEHEYSMATPGPSVGLKRPWPTSTAKVHKMLLDITREDTGEEEVLTPQKKLLNSIDKVEKVVMEEIQKMKSSPSAKRAEREKRVRTLMSMR